MKLTNHNYHNNCHWHFLQIVNLHFFSPINLVNKSNICQGRQNFFLEKKLSKIKKVFFSEGNTFWRNGRRGSPIKFSKIIFWDVTCVTCRQYYLIMCTKTVNTGGVKSQMWRISWNFLFLVLYWLQVYSKEIEWVMGNFFECCVCTLICV